jgi:hypothetical protein
MRTFLAFILLASVLLMPLRGHAQTAQAIGVFTAELTAKETALTASAQAILASINTEKVAAGQPAPNRKAEAQWIKDHEAVETLINGFLGAGAYNRSKLDTDVTHLSSAVPGDTDIADMPTLLRYRAMWWRARTADLAIRDALDKANGMLGGIKNNALTTPAAK